MLPHTANTILQLLQIWNENVILRIMIKEAFDWQCDWSENDGQTSYWLFDTTDKLFFRATLHDASPACCYSRCWSTRPHTYYCEVKTTKDNIYKWYVNVYLQSGNVYRFIWKTTNLYFSVPFISAKITKKKKEKNSQQESEKITNTFIIRVNWFDVISHADTVKKFFRRGVDARPYHVRSPGQRFHAKDYIRTLSMVCNRVGTFKTDFDNF